MIFHHRITATSRIPKPAFEQRTGDLDSSSRRDITAGDYKAQSSMYKYHADRSAYFHVISTRNPYFLCFLWQGVGRKSAPNPDSGCLFHFGEFESMRCFLCFLENKSFAWKKKVSYATLV
jgi:hypothetical protein